MLVERYARVELAAPPVFDSPSGVYGLLELPLRLHPHR